MTREWKPGDVVTGLLEGIEIVGIVRGGGKRMFYADSVTTDQVDLKHVRCLRPLVVIDPEDREQVERLGRLWNKHGHVADVLREFADPKPVEVFEHFVVTAQCPPGALKSVCGKIWQPSDKTVAKVQCPVCVEVVASGWRK